jgi:hypothetical protein
MPKNKACFHCNLSEGRLTYCIGLKNLELAVDLWKSGRSLTEAERSSLKSISGGTCGNGQCTYFHQTCYGRPKSLANAVNLVQECMDPRTKTAVFTARDPRHRACNACLQHVLESTDVKYTGFSGELSCLLFALLNEG